jgi:uncharacterized protein (DUF1778 family)
MVKKKRQTVSDATKQSGQRAKRGKRLAEERTMLSIRLTERERALLTEAASIHEQSPTGFIKAAAISHAAHVVNTSKKTTLNFEALAHTAATLLFTKEFVREYRTKYLTEPDFPVVGEKVLTLGGIHDEFEQFVDHGGADDTAVPARWLEISTERRSESADEPKRYTLPDFECPDAPIIRDNRVPMTKNDFLQLQRAVRLGGTEFLQRILEIGRTSHFQEEDLDEPIDPQTID